MDEEQINSVEEVATHEQYAQDQDTQADPVPSREEVQDKNWREMRKRQEDLENRLRQKDDMLEKLLSAQIANQAPAPEVDVEDPDEEYIPAGRVRGIARKTVQPIEEKVKALEARVAQQDHEKRLASFRSKYSDFDDIVNAETLELLEKREPELTLAISETKDPYKMGIQMYKYIKALNLVGELPSSRRSKEVNKKIEDNAKTVQTPLAYDKRPMAQAFKTTAADRTRLYEEMMHYASQAQGL